VKYLIDTSVLSELARHQPDQRVLHFIETAVEPELWLSAISIGEITKGIISLPPGKKRAALEDWAQQAERRFGDRILPIGVETARTWGRLCGGLRAKGIQLPTADGLIAATALTHGLYVATRNVNDFEPTGVLLINPWE
jgi:predicted nucleic acid-binding protein